MSESLESTSESPSALLTPLGATNADVCIDGVCLVPSAEAKEPVDED